MNTSGKLDFSEGRLSWFQTWILLKIPKSRKKNIYILASNLMWWGLPTLPGWDPYPRPYRHSSKAVFLLSTDRSQSPKVAKKSHNCLRIPPLPGPPGCRHSRQSFASIRIKPTRRKKGISLTQIKREWGLGAESRYVIPLLHVYK